MVAVNNQPNSWYVRGEGNQPAGPFTTEQIFQWWQAGRLRADAVCWREEMAQWLPLSQVEPFASAIRGAAATAQATSPYSIGVVPPLPVGKPFLSPRLFGPLIGVSIVGVLAVVLGVVLSQCGGRFSSGDKASRNTAALADIIANYATRLKEAYNAPQTEIQRQEAVTAAVEELKARVEKCGIVAFTGKVAEIIPEGARYAGSLRWETRNRWGITMSLPQDFEPLARDGACTFGSKVWVELEKKDALSIRKGDPITVRGAVSYVGGAVLLGGMDGYCIEMQVWPSNANHPSIMGIGGMGQPHTIVVRVSDNVKCSVGRFRSLPVLRFMAQ
jgi:hypothetical protein